MPACKKDVMFCILYVWLDAANLSFAGLPAVLNAFAQTDVSKQQQ